MYVSFARVASIVLFSVVAGCGSSADSDQATSDEGALTEGEADGWTSLGTGVAFQSLNDGADVLIVYGGYSATDNASRGFAKALVSARLGEKGIGQVYAVKGPNQSGYQNKEIANSKLIARLQAENANAQRIVVIAHSSGGFVANELFAGLERKAPDMIGKINYFDLDGAQPSTSLHFRTLVFVSAHDGRTGTDSANASIMKSAAQERGVPHESIDASESGCNSGAKWCVHDAMITSKPHNPAKYDLERDYTDFGDSRSVIVSYFDRLD